MKLLVVDVCDTLYKSNTSFDFLDYHFKDEKKYKFFKSIRKSLIYKAISIIYFKITGIDINKVLFTKCLRGIDSHEINNSFEEFYIDFLDKNKIFKTHQLVRDYKNKGYYVLIISASYDFIVNKIANKIEADQYFSTILEYSNNYLTGKIIKDLLNFKLSALLNSNIDFSELVVLTDNVTDFKLVEIATKAYIPINKRNREFWINNKSDKIEFIEV